MNNSDDTPNVRAANTETVPRSSSPCETCQVCSTCSSRARGEDFTAICHSNAGPSKRQEELCAPVGLSDNVYIFFLCFASVICKRKGWLELESAILALGAPAPCIKVIQIKTWGILPFCKHC